MNENHLRIATVVFVHAQAPSPFYSSGFLRTPEGSDGVWINSRTVFKEEQHALPKTADSYTKQA